MGQEQIPLLLSKYFSLSGSVVLPGIGLLRREYLHAKSDRQNYIDPPFFQFFLDSYFLSPPENQVSYISFKTGITFNDAVGFLDQLGNEISTFLEKERKLDWAGVGFFQKDEEGMVTFHAKTMSTQYFKSLQSIEVDKPESNEIFIVSDKTEPDPIVLPDLVEQVEDTEPVRPRSNTYAWWIILLCITIAFFYFLWVISIH